MPNSLQAGKSFEWAIALVQACNRLWMSQQPFLQPIESGMQSQLATETDQQR
jgi:hypothetical protein